MPPVALYSGTIGITMVLSMTRRSMAAAGEALLCRSVAARLTVTAALAGALLEGAVLAILGMGAVELGWAAAMALQLRRLRRA